MSIKHSHQGRFKVGIDLFGIGVGRRGTVLVLPGLRNTRHREHRLDVITFQKPHRRTNFLVRHVNAGAAKCFLKRRNRTRATEVNRRTRPIENHALDAVHYINSLVYCANNSRMRSASAS